MEYLAESVHLCLLPCETQQIPISFIWWQADRGTCQVKHQSPKSLFFHHMEIFIYEPCLLFTLQNPCCLLYNTYMLIIHPFSVQNDDIPTFSITKLIHGTLLVILLVFA